MLPGRLEGVDTFESSGRSDSSRVLDVIRPADPTPRTRTMVSPRRSDADGLCLLKDEFRRHAGLNSMLVVSPMDRRVELPFRYRHLDKHFDAPNGRLLAAERNGVASTRRTRDWGRGLEARFYVIHATYPACRAFLHGGDSKHFDDTCWLAQRCLEAYQTIGRGWLLRLFPADMTDRPPDWEAFLHMLSWNEDSPILIRQKRQMWRNSIVTDWCATDHEFQKVRLIMPGIKFSPPEAYFSEITNFALASAVAIDWIMAREAELDAPPSLRRPAPPTTSVDPPKCRKTGRPRDTDPKADRILFDAWQSGSYQNFAALGVAFRKNPKEVRRAIDRVRKRRGSLD